jgi:hypothetical protein
MVDLAFPYALNELISGACTTPGPIHFVAISISPFRDAHSLPNNSLAIETTRSGSNPNFF